jgi:hypothetical protein
MLYSRENAAARSTRESRKKRKSFPKGRISASEFRKVKQRAGKREPREGKRKKERERERERERGWVGR